MASKRRVGIVGYGSLGKYLAKEITSNPAYELAFVWNRTSDKIREDTSIPASCILEDLNDFASRGADLIIEVAHPALVISHGHLFLAQADLMVGSPTAFADRDTETRLRDLANSGNHALYVPSGALWGAKDIQKMANRGTLKGLTITMKKHPNSLKVLPPLTSFGEADSTTGEYVVFQGSVRDLCPLAPNNVNTMACAAIAGHNLGFDRVVARLVADSRLQAHVIEIEVVGPSDDVDTFKVTTQRYNPARPGAVTGNATYDSFVSSLHEAGGRANGLHLC